MIVHMMSEIRTALGGPSKTLCRREGRLEMHIIRVQRMRRYLYETPRGRAFEGTEDYRAVTCKNCMSLFPAGWAASLNLPVKSLLTCEAA